MFNSHPNQNFLGKVEATWTLPNCMVYRHAEFPDGVTYYSAREIKGYDKTLVYMDIGKHAHDAVDLLKTLASHILEKGEHFQAFDSYDDGRYRLAFLDNNETPGILLALPVQAILSNPY